MGIKKAKTQRGEAADRGRSRRGPADHGRPSSASTLPGRTKQTQMFEGDAEGSGGEAGGEAEIRGAGPMSGILVVMEQRAASGTACRWRRWPPAQQLGARIEPTGERGSRRGTRHAGDELAQKKLDKVYAVEHDLLEDVHARRLHGGARAADRAGEAARTCCSRTPTRCATSRRSWPRASNRCWSATWSRIRVDGGATGAGAAAVPGQAECGCALRRRPRRTSPPCRRARFAPTRSSAGSRAGGEVRAAIDAATIRTKPLELFRESQRAVDLTAADIIVSVGRGIKENGKYPDRARSWPTALGAELAASRPICDNGWLPMERQVGSSGQTVAPKMYMAVGISGAIQHLVGMKGSKTIVAINKDPKRPSSKWRTTGSSAICSKWCRRWSKNQEGARLASRLTSFPIAIATFRRRPSNFVRQTGVFRNLRRKSSGVSVASSSRAGAYPCGAKAGSPVTGAGGSRGTHPGRCRNRTRDCRSPARTPPGCAPRSSIVKYEMQRVEIQVKTARRPRARWPRSDTRRCSGYTCRNGRAAGTSGSISSDDQQFAEEEPRAHLLVDQARVFADPSQPAQRAYDRSSSGAVSTQILCSNAAGLRAGAARRSAPAPRSTS